MSPVSQYFILKQQWLNLDDIKTSVHLYNYYNKKLFNSSVGLLFGKSWRLKGKHKNTRNKFKTLSKYQRQTDLGARASSHVQPSARYMHSDEHTFKKPDYIAW